MNKDAFNLAVRRMLDWMIEQHLSHKTRRSYTAQIHRYKGWLWKNRARVRDLPAEEKVEQYLTFHAKRGCTASTQNGMFHALRCFYHRGLNQELQGVDALRATRPVRERRCPTIAEVRAILPMVPNLYGYPAQLICEWLYGSGLRVNEPLNARLKDIDFENCRFTVRNGKHDKDRVVPIPCSIIERLREQVEIAEFIWRRNLQQRVPVPLPGLLARKYPNTQYSRGWSWLFPAKKPCRFEGFDGLVQWRIHEAVIQRAFKKGVLASGAGDDLSPHHLRHGFVTHSDQLGSHVRDIQIVVGHKSLETTMTYLHPEVDRIKNPLDSLNARLATERSEQALRIVA